MEVRGCSGWAVRGGVWLLGLGSDAAGRRSGGEGTLHGRSMVLSMSKLHSVWQAWVGHHPKGGRESELGGLGHRRGWCPYNMAVAVALSSVDRGSLTLPIIIWSSV
jgi:hypothetical protein